jgi:hypothetical protein
MDGQREQLRASRAQLASGDVQSVAQRVYSTQYGLRVSAEIRISASRPFNTYETTATETRARAATSGMVGA